MLGIREINGDLVIDRSRFAKAVHDPAAFDGLPLRPYNVGPDALLFNFVGWAFASRRCHGTVAVILDGVTRWSEHCQHTAYHKRYLPAGLAVAHGAEL